MDGLLTTHADTFTSKTFFQLTTCITFYLVQNSVTFSWMTHPKIQRFQDFFHLNKFQVLFMKFNDFWVADLFNDCFMSRGNPDLSHLPRWPRAPVSQTPWSPSLHGTASPSGWAAARAATSHGTHWPARLEQLRNTFLQQTRNNHHQSKLQTFRTQPDLSFSKHQLHLGSID